jgi:hypothetical protein
MTELKNIGFRAHPVLGHILNLHLQDNVASRSKFKMLEKKMGEVEHMARDAKRLAKKQGDGGGGN